MGRDQPPGGAHWAVRGCHGPQGAPPARVWQQRRPPAAAELLLHCASDRLGAAKLEELEPSPAARCTGRRAAAGLLQVGRAAVVGSAMTIAAATDPRAGKGAEMVSRRGTGGQCAMSLRWKVEAPLFGWWRAPRLPPLQCNEWMCSCCVVCFWSTLETPPQTDPRPQEVLARLCPRLGEGPHGSHAALPGL